MRRRHRSARDRTPRTTGQQQDRAGDTRSDTQPKRLGGTGRPGKLQGPPLSRETGAPRSHTAWLPAGGAASSDPRRGTSRGFLRGLGRSLGAVWSDRRQKRSVRGARSLASVLIETHPAAHAALGGRLHAHELSEKKTPARGAAWGRHQATGHRPPPASPGPIGRGPEDSPLTRRHTRRARCPEPPEPVCLAGATWS